MFRVEAIAERITTIDEATFQSARITHHGPSVGSDVHQQERTEQSV